MSEIIERLRRRIPSTGERGITGLETAIVLIAFVVASSVLAFGSLSTGLFSSDKTKETVKSGVHGAISALQIRSVKGIAAVTATTSQPIGAGDGSTTTFWMPNAPVIPGSHTLKIDGMTQTYGTAYSVDFDTGLVTFTDAPVSFSEITADYTYYVVGSVKITLSSVLHGYPVDLTGGRTIVVYMDPDSVQTNITDYTLTKYGSKVGLNVQKAPRRENAKGDSWPLGKGIGRRLCAAPESQTTQ